MSSLNKVMLIGNLGKNPEVWHIESGRAKATFSLATNERYKTRTGEQVDKTEWHNVVLWSPLAEIAENHLKKGSKVYIEGKIKSRSYEDRNQQMRYITEVVGREMVLLSSRREEERTLGEVSGHSTPEAPAAKASTAPSAVESTAGPEAETPVPEHNPDDLPF